ncbi:hypothetical protein G6F46_011395 [Rhizopus delemar]|uniref:Reverse transcriptase domain-containing protein n=2 Tax=Rhizopus TaxID=4842 RepID=A0A9P7CJR0_9FUNG|nr:hypothetical protein G6F55_011071 [Rhizopus delemar]KAG1535797.1 hypothetical protein G6F51_011337 [Rhizopus arrhizus]KAG1489889.1 hypothetical protein G6F54_011121 [Rhizopus delemar]KAG1502160.1 hypothetical protein G6F53_010921 [Rhizopus delemar]KAG1514241.1 hypothetical protein G6F52_009969 [Rhizopus delemar]
MILSIIDYFYLGSELHQCLSTTAITRLHPAWSDHSILQSTYTLGASKFGPGLWRANPAYASHQPLQQKLEKGIKKLLKRTDPDRSPQQQWEEVKILTAKIIRSYSIDYVELRSQTIKTLEKKRNRILRTKPSPAIRLQLIPPIDLQLQTLQKELAEVAILKSGIHWQENGEKNITYLKGIHKKRTLQQYITGFQDPTAADITTIHSEPTLMRNIVNKFYQQLYTAYPVRIQCIRDYLGIVNFDHEISEAEGQKLQQKVDFDYIIYKAKRCPKQSSPGSHGVGLIWQVYDDALWNLTELKNWRPIALINCDAKIFARLLTRRLAPLIAKLINPSQKGFIKGRFIGENGMYVHLILQQLRHDHHPGLGLLLDQEKAYDRVLPEYLLEVLRMMKFPESIIHCIHQWFFNNSVPINVNGFFTDTVNQERGLRQGNPLSSLLFNIALEPLLLSIQQDQQYQGYLPSDGTDSQRIRCIVYADDICAFVKDVADFDRLQFHLAQYNTVFNSKFNKDKTEAFSLDGCKSQSWSALLQSNHITTYHHKHSPSAFRYLGYYLPYTIMQRNSIQNMLLEKLKSQFQIYSQPQLSLRAFLVVMLYQIGVPP